MAETTSYREIWQKILVALITVLLTAIVGAIISHFWPPEKKTEPVHLVNNSPSYTTTIINTEHPSGKKKAQPTIKKSVSPKSYVEVYLNINSNDKVLVNSRSVTPEEISEKPNTLKLITGNHYLIKINNCPEKEIIAEEGITISTCM